KREARFRELFLPEKREARFRELFLPEKREARFRELFLPEKREARFRELFLPEKREARLSELPKAGVGAWSQIRFGLYDRRYSSTRMSYPQDIDTWGQIP